MLLPFLYVIPTWFIALCNTAEAAAYFSMLVPALLAWHNRKYLRGGMKALAYLPAYLFSMFILARVSAYFLNYNLALIHISTIGETLLYIKVYYNEFTDAKIKYRIKIFSACFLLFSIIDSVWIEGFQRINSYTNLAESTLVISLGLLFLDRKIIKSDKVNTQYAAMIVATAGIIIYLSGTVVLYLTTNYYISLNDEYNTRLMYLFNSVLLLLLAVLFSRAFLLERLAKA